MGNNIINYRPDDCWVYLRVTVIAANKPCTHTKDVLMFHFLELLPQRMRPQPESLKHDTKQSFNIRATCNTTDLDYVYLDRNKVQHLQSEVVHDKIKVLLLCNVDYMKKHAKLTSKLCTS